MSMNTRVEAYIELEKDKEYANYKKIWEAYNSLKRPYPNELWIYIHNNSINPDTFLLDNEIKLEQGVHYYEFNQDMETGIEVYLNKLPKEVYKLRFVNSW